MAPPKDPSIVKPSENANPGKTLRMRYDAWKKAGSKPFSTVPTSH